MSQSSSPQVPSRFARLSRRQRTVLVALALSLALAITATTVLIIFIPDAPSATISTTSVPHAAAHPLTTTPLAQPAPSVLPTQQWANAGPDFAQAIAFAPSAAATAYSCGSAGRAGQQMALGISHDGARTWTALATNLTGQACLLSVSPTTADDVALAIAQCHTTCDATATVALYRSANGGTTWTQALLPSVGFGLVMGWAGTTLYVATNAPQHPLAVSVAGQPFTLQDDLARYAGQLDFLGAIGTTMYAELAVPTQGTPTAPASPTLVTSGDGGAIWSQAILSDAPFPIHFARPATDGKVLIGLEQSDTLATSLDFGQTWVAQPPFPSGQTLATPTFVAYAPDGTLIALLQAAQTSDSTTTLAVLAPGSTNWQPISPALPANTVLDALSWNSAGHPVALWATSSTLTTAKQLWTYQLG